MYVKAMTKIIPIRISPDSGKTHMSSINGYLQQETPWIIGTWSMWVFRMSRKSQDNLVYLTSRKSTCTPNTVCLSANGMIASNHFSREYIISSKETTPTIDDEYYLLPNFWKGMDLAEKKAVV